MSESEATRSYGFDSHALPDRRPASRGVDERGRHGGRRWTPEMLQADRAGDAQRPVRPVGRVRHRDRRAPAGSQPGGTRSAGASTRSRSSRTSRSLFWETGWYLTYHYWPTSHNTAHLRGNALLRPRRRNVRERLAQELARRHDQGVRPAGRQHPRGDADGARVAGRHDVPAGRPGDPVPAPAQGGPRLGRRLPAASRDARARSRPRPERGDTDAHCFPPSSPTSSPSPDWCLRQRARALREAPGQHHGRDAGVLRRRLPAAEDGIDYLDDVPLDDTARGRDAPAVAPRTRSSSVSFPVEIWRQPRVPDSGAASIDVVVEPAI